MREQKNGNVLSVRAIGGLHVVTLAGDFTKEALATQKDLLGFAIERAELKDGKEIERYFLRGIKRFKHKDEGLAPGTPVPTSEHPVQTFQWGDYTAKPDVVYRYAVVPCYGQPKLLRLDRAAACEVEIRTEAEQDEEGKDGKLRHDVYFNRGVAGSQAYARRFNDEAPDEDDPGSEQMKWLSRGLFEALTGFIAKAKNKDFGLRAMLYEFRYGPVGAAFAEAAARGVDVDIRYEAQAYKAENEAMIRKTKIKGLCKPQKSRAGIRHNKFIVLMHKEEPVAVWTGSTNISAGGIFGHSNVGHAIWDREVAERYLDYWNRLAADDVGPSSLRKANLDLEPTPQAGKKPPLDRTMTLFSPRDQKDTPATLNWYADLISGAQQIVCMTFAFNLDDVFKTLLEQRSEAVRYAVFDKRPSEEFQDEVAQVDDTVIAPGALLKKGDFEKFLGEHLTGFNHNPYIHDKFLLVDPLSRDPIVVTGSANFSRPSQTANDENMLVIRRNLRVADIYFGEFMRIFDHFYSRYVVRRLHEAKASDPDAGYLKETMKEWLPMHYKPGRKQKRRLAFMAR